MNHRDPFLSGLLGDFTPRTGGSVDLASGCHAGGCRLEPLPDQHSASQNN